MEIPDVKKQAKEAIDNLRGTPLGMVQIGMTDQGHCCCFVAGVPQIIVHVLASVMKDNHQLMELFEAAWRKAVYENEDVDKNLKDLINPEEN